MKALLVVFCFFATSAALAQSSAGGGVLSAEPSVLQFNSHANHAAQQGMSQSQTVMERSDTVMAQGERPLWEFAPKVIERPLGDTARLLKKERLSAKKANSIWEN